MTLYWWTHWFWITAFVGFFLLDHNNFVGTHPLTSPYGNKDYSKDKPLKFPLAAQTDIDDDDIFQNDEMILSSILRNSKIAIRQQKDMTQINEEYGIKIKDNIVVPPMMEAAALGEAQPIFRDGNDPNKTESNTNEPRTKPVDVNLVKNHNSSKIISTQSSIVSNSTETGAKETINRILLNSDNNKTIIPNVEDNDDLTQNKPPPSSNFDPSQSSPASSSTTLLPLSSSSSPPPSSSSSPSLSSTSPTTTKLDIIHPPRNHRFPFENITKEEEIIRAEIARQLDGERARKSKVLAEYRQELRFNFSTDTKNLLARSAAISLDDFHQEQDEGNISSEALSIQRAYILDAGAISGICFAVVGIFCGVGMAGVVLYRRRYLNKPQALSEPDSSGYIDDSTIRDNSDEMYSLDNDSFLNSLEAMTIQNYWTDTVKHTKL